MEPAQSLIKVVTDVPRPDGVLHFLSLKDLRQLSLVNKDLNKQIQGYTGTTVKVIVSGGPANARWPLDRKRVEYDVYERSGVVAGVDIPIDHAAEDLHEYYDKRIMEAWMDEIFYESFLNDVIGTCEFDEMILRCPKYYDPDIDEEKYSHIGPEVTNGPIYIKEVMLKLLRWNRKTLKKMTIESVPRSIYHGIAPFILDWIPSTLKTSVRFEALEELEFSRHLSIKDSLIFVILSLSPNLRRVKIRGKIYEKKICIDT